MGDSLLLHTIVIASLTIPGWNASGILILLHKVKMHFSIPKARGDSSKYCTINISGDYEGAAESFTFLLL